MIAMVVVETAVLVVLCILVGGLLRAYATVLQRLHVLDGGDNSAAPPFRTAEGVVAPAPIPSARAKPVDAREFGIGHDITGVGLSGEIISVRTVGTGFDTVLIFLSSGCSGCGGFWEDLTHRREMSIGRDARILVVTKGPEAESVGMLNDLCPAGVDLVMSSQAWDDFAVPGSPYVVVVDGTAGRITGEGSGTSLTQVSGLVRQALGDLGNSAGDRRFAKPRPDTEREVDVDRVLLAAGISPGHPSLYSAPDGHSAVSTPEHLGLPGIRSGTSQ